MNYYQLLKLNTFINSLRLKLFGIWLLHILNKRYLGVYFDPVMACNLRCKMCYFTDASYTNNLKGVFKASEIPVWSKALLTRALKLQIGCGTEPTLYPQLLEVIESAKAQGVPYISLTTNANLLEKDKIEQWIQAGLNEITISLHGVFKETYETFMQKGDYHQFVQSLQSITELKKTYPYFKLRINYTFNEANFYELSDFWSVFDTVAIDILQIRPIQRLGNTAYQNFSMDTIIPIYTKMLNYLKKEAHHRGVSLLAPDALQLKSGQSTESFLTQFTYCYASPNYCWRTDFDWKKESFNAYAKRTNWTTTLLKSCFYSKKQLQALQNKSLNYQLY
ncbi:MAG: radical SAM protein [Bacteroidetes bacterium]|nr:radical SAM protein [Bacteroidota bacterium]